MNIYLSGLIGVGKTTVGRKLAAELGWAFDDLDTAMADLVVLDRDPAYSARSDRQYIKIAPPG